MPYCGPNPALCRVSHYERQVTMDRDPQVESDTELVAETLVEEVSIDGMCGVY